MFGGKGLKAALIALTVVMTSVPAAAETVLRRGNGAEPESLDPAKATGVPETNVLNDLFEGLMTLSPDGKAVPGVAESYTASPDGKTYRFTLRAKAKWSNGETVTAEDFRYSLIRVLTPETNSDYAPILRIIEGAEAFQTGKSKDPASVGIKVIDARNIEFKLKGPAPYFLAMMTHHVTFPVHRKTVEKFGDQWPRPANIVSNGAYRLTDWKPQAQIVVEKNPAFHDAANVKIDKVMFLPTENDTEELKRYRAGELDTTNTVPLDQRAWAKANMPNDYRVAPYIGSYYYNINLTRAPLGKSAKLRRALSMAIDREILVDKVLASGQVAAYSLVPKGIAGYTPPQADYAAMPQAERLAEAKRLMAEEGYGPEKPLEVEILYNTNEGHKKIAVVIAAMWKQIGVKTTLVNQEWKVYLETRDQKNFQVARAAWIADYLDPSTFLELLISNAGYRNDPGYANPAFDKEMELAAQEADAAKRMAHLQAAEAMSLADLPYIPIYHYVSIKMISPKLKGWDENLLDLHPTRWVSFKN